MRKKATVDIIIPVYKPDTGFRLLLQRLQEQTYPINRIIIMNTEEVYWEKYRNIPEIRMVLDKLNVPYEVHHVRKEEFDHGATRRRGVVYSKADIFVCMTQDAMPADRHLIEKLVDPFLDNEGSLIIERQDEPVAAVAYARQLPTKDCKEAERYTRAFNYPESNLLKMKADIPKLGIKTFFCSDVCAAYRRDVYEILDGFPRQAIFNEDMIFAGHAIQDGYGVAYQAEAKVIHSHNYNCMQQFHRNFDLAVSQKQHPEVFVGIKSESEGMRLVKKTARHLLTIHKPWLIVDLIVKSGFKYLGYKAGMHYDIMPKDVVLRCTMNKEFWHRYWRR